MSKQARQFLITQGRWDFLRQFEGEVIHVDFSQEEVEKFRKYQHVPQRTLDDCTRFLLDYPDFDLDYVAPIMIRIEPSGTQALYKDRSSLPPSLVRQRHRKELGFVNRSSDRELQAIYKLQPCSTFNHASGDVIDFKFSPINNQFAVCCNTLTNDYNRPGNLLFGDAKLEVVSALNGHADRTVGAERYYTVSDIRFSNDGQYLYSGSYDNTVKIWDVRGDLVSCLTGHGRITALSTTWCSDRVLAVASDDGNVYLYDVLNPRKQQRTVVKGRNERLCGAFLVPGQRHYSHWMLAGYEAKNLSPFGALYIIDIPTGTIIQKVVPASNCQSAAYFHPSANHFVVGATGHFFGAGPSTKSVVRVFDPRTEKASMEIGIDSSQKDINKVTMSPCGFRVTSSGTDGKIFVWDLRTIKEASEPEPLHVLAHGRTKMVPPVDGQLEDWDTGVSVTDWLPQSDYLMTGGSDGFIKLWDIRLKDPFLRDIAEFDSPVSSADFNCERDTLGVGESSGRVTFLDWHGPTISGELRRFRLEQPVSESSGNEGILAARELIASGMVVVREEGGLRAIYAA
jgi:WD40 repeat protein